MLERRYLSAGDFAVDIGSNDGGLLACLSNDIDILGIEPAENVAAVARRRGVPTETEYFDPETARDVRESSGSAEVICANNVVAHIQDLHEFFEGVEELLTADGVFVMEVPYLLDLLSETQFSTIYHEHLSYFSITSLSTLVESHDMYIAGLERLDRHGGSIRVHIRKRGTEVVNDFENRVRDLRRLESAHGLSDPAIYEKFADRVRRKRETIRSLISDITEGDATVVGYGASAKGNIILNYCDIGSYQIDYIVDEMEAKQGKYSPGQSIPVRSPNVFHEDQPEYTVLLAWNYWELIREKESNYLDSGGTFVLPSPYVDIRSEFSDP
jgi:D-mycarose 3-C-methyltransferase